MVTYFMMISLRLRDKRNTGDDLSRVLSGTDANCLPPS